MRTIAIFLLFLLAATAAAPVGFFFYSASPVLTKGGTYDTWQSDALAAPAVVCDGPLAGCTMTASLWNASSGKWASGFFTASSLAGPWAYISGSLGNPGSNYILGNAGLTYFAGKYWFAYNQYTSGNPAPLIVNSTTTFTSWGTPLTLVSGYGADPSLDVNPVNGKMEVWYVTAATDGNQWHRSFHMQDTPDGVTWTDEGAFMAWSDAGAAFNFGEPSVWYVGTTRYITFDQAPLDGCRSIHMAHSINRDTSWVLDGEVLAPWWKIFWESQQVFDSSVIVADLGDGLGSIPRMMYAGSDTTQPTDGTDSSIGLAFQNLGISSLRAGKSRVAGGAWNK